MGRIDIAMKLLGGISHATSNTEFSLSRICAISPDF